MASSQDLEETTLGQYGGFVTRLAAYWIDQAIVAGIVTVIMTVIRYVLDLFGISELLASGKYVDLILLISVLLVTVLTNASYHIAFWMLAGQTPGKRLMGVRVVRSAGGRIRFWRAVVRWLGYSVSGILFIGYLWILVDNKRQGFHDKLADTVVVYSWPEGKQRGTFIRDRARQFRQMRESLRKEAP